MSLIYFLIELLNTSFAYVNIKKNANGLTQSASLRIRVMSAGVGDLAFL